MNFRLNSIINLISHIYKEEIFLLYKRTSEIDD